jgi:molybdate transport repressor ModE-like protein
MGAGAYSFRVPLRLPAFEALKLLVGIDDYGSLSAAARFVQMSQPNASRAIRELERRFALPLVERSPNGSTLTAQGTVLVHWARQILVDVEKLLTIAEGLRAESGAHLTVTASITVAEHLMPLWLARFRAQYPDVTIYLQARNSTQVIDEVRSGLCDVGFIESPHPVRGLHSTEVGRDELVVVVDPNHPWARRRTPLTAAELAATPLLVREPGSGTRTTIELALQDYDIATPLLELGSASAIRTSVLNGVGPAVLSTLAVAEHVRTGALRIVAVEDLHMLRSLRAVWQGSRRLEGTAATLLKLVFSEPP